MCRIGHGPHLTLDRLGAARLSGSCACHCLIVLAYVRLHLQQGFTRAFCYFVKLGVTLGVALLYGKATITVVGPVSTSSKMLHRFCSSRCTLPTPGAVNHTTGSDKRDYASCPRSFLDKELDSAPDRCTSSTA